MLPLTASTIDDCENLVLGGLTRQFETRAPRMKRMLSELEIAASHDVTLMLIGETGCGKTFFGRWVQEQAKQKGFATAEVQISETETPLHKLETVYRRAMEQLSTAEVRERIGRCAREAVIDRFSPETILRQYVNVFMSLVGK